MYRMIRCFGGLSVFVVLLVLSGCMAFRSDEIGTSGSTTPMTASGQVTVRVLTSKGEPIQGAGVCFYKPGYSWRCWPQKTDSKGEITGTLPQTGTWSVKVTVGNTSSSQDVYISTEPTIITFRTSQITIKLETWSGAPLAGGKVYCKANVSPGTWFKIGETGGDGTVIVEMFPGNWDFKVEYNQTVGEKKQDVAQNPVVVFKTTKVTLYHDGVIQYRGNPSSGTFFPMTNPPRGKFEQEMLPGTISFKFHGAGEIPINISGREFNGALVVVELKDSSGNPLSGATVLRKGGPVSSGTWFNFGTTDGNGRVFGILTPGYNYSFQVQYNMTHAEECGKVPEKLRYTFQTKKVTVQLQTCGGLGLSGGYVKYRGSISSGTWFSFGNTGLDGKVSKELFPGNWWFGVEYRQTYTEKQQDISIDPTVIFATTQVTSSYSGKIEYKGNPSSGTWFSFTSPMEMLPGNITFRFGGTSVKTISISGCSVEISPN